MSWPTPFQRVTSNRKHSAGMSRLRQYACARLRIRANKVPRGKLVGALALNLAHAGDPTPPLARNSRAPAATIDLPARPPARRRANRFDRTAGRKSSADTRGSISVRVARWRKRRARPRHGERVFLQFRPSLQAPAPVDRERAALRRWKRGPFRLRVKRYSVRPQRRALNTPSRPE